MKCSFNCDNNNVCCNSIHCNFNLLKSNLDIRSIMLMLNKKSSSINQTMSNIIHCNCINQDDSCLIFCFNINSNKFESINCKNLI